MTRDHHTGRRARRSPAGLLAAFLALALPGCEAAEIFGFEDEAAPTHFVAAIVIEADETLRRSEILRAMVAAAADLKPETRSEGRPGVLTVAINSYDPEGQPALRLSSGLVDPVTGARVLNASIEVGADEDSFFGLGDAADDLWGALFGEDEPSVEGESLLAREAMTLLVTEHLEPGGIGVSRTDPVAIRLVSRDGPAAQPVPRVDTRSLDDLGPLIPSRAAGEATPRYTDDLRPPDLSTPRQAPAPASVPSLPFEPQFDTGEPGADRVAPNPVPLSTAPPLPNRATPEGARVAAARPPAPVPNRPTARGAGAPPGALNATTQALHLGAFQDDRAARQYLAWVRQSAPVQLFGTRQLVQRHGADPTGALFHAYVLPFTPARAAEICRAFAAEQLACTAVPIQF